jgi:hypothetical protein
MTTKLHLLFLFVFILAKAHMHTHLDCFSKTTKRIMGHLC